VRVELHSSVTDADNAELIKPIHDLEIKEAIFQMDKYKAPGSDGFGAAFFQDYWHIINKDVCHAIKTFFREGKLLKQINHTLITLIPKVDNPSSPVHFRPISLCNTLYKIIAKITVNRMRPIIERIVDSVQSAFVPKRSIHDNILLAHEIMNKFHNMKGRKSWVAIKLDMKKAYDQVEWAFLFQTLTALGFHSKWVQLIKRARQPLNCKLGKQSMFPKQDVWH